MQLPDIGDVVADKYRIEELLGEGGFGCVYRGLAEHSGREVAIKVLKPGQDGYPLGRAQRFLREMRAVARLQSPYTLTLFDCGQTDDGLLFMVTEYIDGVDLDQLLLTRGSLTERETVHVVMQILLSLTEAHEAGVLHRDIKPSNIRLFEYDGDPLRAKLLDFGLARSLDTDEVRLTGTGNVIGTPRYMSPEQLVGADLTPASDIYSLGLVARECVLGRADVAALNSRRLGEEDPVSPAFRALCNAMLEHESIDRLHDAHATYEHFRGRLHELDSPSSTASVPDPTIEEKAPTTVVEVIPDQRPHPHPSQGRRAPLVIAVVVVAALFGAIWLGLKPQPPPPAPATPEIAAPLLNPLVAQDEPEPQSGRLDVGAPDPDELDGCATFDGKVGYRVLELPSDALTAPEEVTLHLPRDYEAGKRHALLIAFRDFRSSSKSIIRRSRLRRLSNNRNVIVVAPNDLGGLKGVWESRDDMHHARSVVDEVKRSYCIDESRIFAYGHGMGGRAVDLLRCEIPSVVAAATTSYRPEQSPLAPCKQGTVIPRINFDPQKNPRAPVEGGAGCGLTRPVISSDQHEEQLRGERGCATEHETWFEHKNGLCRKWACKDGPLVTCRVDGGREFNDTKPREGIGIDPNCDGTPVEFPYTKTLWDFFAEVEEDG